MSSRGRRSPHEVDVEFARPIDATPEEVFDAFTDPEGQRELYRQLGEAHPAERDSD